MMLEQNHNVCPVGFSHEFLALAEMERVNATVESAKLQVPILYSTFNISEVCPYLGKLLVLLCSLGKLLCGFLMLLFSLPFLVCIVT